MTDKNTIINKYQPIFRIPKEWINPKGERRIQIPVLITFGEDTIVITKQNNQTEVKK